MEYVSTMEAATLFGCSVRAVQARISRGTLPADAIEENGVTTYAIPLTAFPERLQRRYYEQHDAPVPPELSTASKPVRAPRTMEQLTADEREEAARWIRILEDWQLVRFQHTGSLAEADARYIAKLQTDNPDLTISYGVLNRRLKAWQSDPPDMGALVEQRGKSRRGVTDIPAEVLEIFTRFRRQAHPPPIAQTIFQTKTLLQMEGRGDLLEQMPSDRAFYRWHRANRQLAGEVYAQQGAKAYRDLCGLYISRDYAQLQSNDLWVWDGHTLDVQCVREDGLVYRPTLYAVVDVRSWAIVGTKWSEHANIDTSLQLAHATMSEHGIPRGWLSDNGREVANYPVAGLGHRWSKGKGAPRSPKSAFERLGIETHFAQPANGRAKTIERAFGVLATLSKLWDTYCGNTPGNRPEGLKVHIKAGNIPRDTDVFADMDLLIRGWYNQQPYSGAVAADRGLTRWQVYQKHLHTKRMATPGDLALLLMRSERLQKVGRLGVGVKVAGKTLWYGDEEMHYHLQGKPVFVRYDPAHLLTVRVYDTEDRYMCTLPQRRDLKLGYFATSEEVAQMERFKYAAAKAVDERVRELRAPLDDYDNPSALSLIRGKGHANPNTLMHRSPEKLINMEQVTERRHYTRERSKGEILASDIEMIYPAIAKDAACVRFLHKVASQWRTLHCTTKIYRTACENEDISLEGLIAAAEACGVWQHKTQGVA